MKPSTNGRRVPLLKKLFGIPVEHHGHQECFAETNADGYTILDAEKLVGSEKFQQLSRNIETFAIKHNIAVNGHQTVPPGDSSERKE